MTPKISVIIPVFRVEDYLPRCLDSLKVQTFKNWEAICIDDGSPDSCPEILDRYAAEDSRIKVYHCKNAGAATARNKALDLISGEYCLMVDSDDFLHPQLMEICLHYALKTDADFVAYTYHHPYHTLGEIRHFFGMKDREVTCFKNYDIQSIEYKVFDDVFSCTTENPHPKGKDKRWTVKHCQPWRCLYRSSVVKGNKFTPGIMYEDIAWWGGVLLSSSRACVLNLPLYYYYPNRTGYIHSAPSTYRIESLRRAISDSEEIFSRRADERQKQAWEKNFLSIFRRRLEKKERKSKR